jgi:transcription antitermination factor NusG
MKASVLIGKLRALVREHGDRDVFLDVGDIRDIEDVDLESTEHDIIIWPTNRKPTLAIGDKVKVTDGPFYNLTAEVQAVEANLVHAAVNVYGRPVEACFCVGQLRKVAA